MWHEWEGQTFNKIFDYACQEWGDREALVSYDLRLTYREYRRKIFALADGLHKAGIKKGTKVAHLLPVTPEWAYLYWALHRLGAVLVPLNITWVGREIVQGLDLTDTEVLVVTDNFRGINYVSVLREMFPEMEGNEAGKLRLEKLPCLEKLIVVSPGGNKYGFAHDFNDLMAAGRGYSDQEITSLGEEVKPDDICLFLLTSGTSGFPKPAIHTEQNILFGMAGYADGMELRETDRELIVAPNYHVAGILCLGYPVLRGACAHLIEFFDPEEALRTIEKEKITIIFGFDIHFLRMKQHPHYQHYNISSMKKTMIGSNPGSYEAIKEMGITHQGNIYGFTEYVASQAYLPYRDRHKEEKMKYGHGRPMCGAGVTRFKVVDPETGGALKPGEPGELCVMGPALFKGYYRMEDEFRACMDSEGFFHSGDYGWVDGDGYVYYRGRIKEMIKTGGENVAAREVEIFLETECPWVEIAQVFGVPDARWGEAVTAMVQLAPGSQVSAEELREFCRGKMAGYKIPKHFLVVRPDQWIVTPTGKHNKVALRQKAMESLGV